ncbi:hypothetical protein WJX73_000734 [Symbiochloris irregularis]|uniref:RWP-RK domain-containing protein n=1 Tax=Symbiochloris irregularis TaxID=706552 RepID=A0AAW1PJG3_9CHLO
MTAKCYYEHGGSTSGLLLAHFADEFAYQEFQRVANQQKGCLSCSAAHSPVGWLIGIAEYANEHCAARAREALETVCLQGLPGQCLGPACLDGEDTTDHCNGMELQQRSGSNGSNSSSATVMHGSARIKDITFEQVAQHFQYGLSHAASLLGISTSSLKRLCRQHGIKEWPCRKLRHQAFVEQRHKRTASPMPCSPSKRSTAPPLRPIRSCPTTPMPSPSPSPCPSPVPSSPFGAAFGASAADTAPPSPSSRQAPLAAGLYTLASAPTLGSAPPQLSAQDFSFARRHTVAPDFNTNSPPSFAAGSPPGFTNMGPPAAVPMPGHQASINLSASQFSAPQAFDLPLCRQLSMRMDSLGLAATGGPLNLDMLRLPSTDMSPVSLERFPSFLLAKDLGVMPPAPSLSSSDAQLQCILSSVVAQQNSQAGQDSGMSGNHGQQGFMATTASTPFSASAFTPWDRDAEECMQSANSPMLHQMS